MGAITIRKLPEDVKQRLRMRAAAHGRSMEAEARGILLSALDEPHPVDLTWIEMLMGAARDYGGDAGVELDIAPDEPVAPPEFADLPGHVDR